MQEEHYVFLVFFQFSQKMEGKHYVFSQVLGDQKFRDT
jgi:hypothetical protein